MCKADAMARQPDAIAEELHPSFNDIVKNTKLLNPAKPKSKFASPPPPGEYPTSAPSPGPATSCVA